MSSPHPLPIQSPFAGRQLRLQQHHTYSGICSYAPSVTFEIKVQPMFGDYKKCIYLCIAFQIKGTGV
ncbi:hypothetical protein HMPREF9151_02324 [Hoylesella saccharolytica F0055]|uniref:Uncharacterized protein n=1 Tax=Hoylesella saccharolytica F0055 TaxID=1127699 RepID=L1N089_9BACT|nr:hypothetical protein HMPREF9151_02324 [Hoylesella saccharolytica F0055]